MKQIIHKSLNFCKNFALSTKSITIDTFSIKAYLKQNLKLITALLNVISGILIGSILSYLDCKMHDSMFILTLIYTTLKPMGWILIGLVIFTFIIPFCIISPTMSNICEGVGLLIEKGIQKFNITFFIYLFLFLTSLFDSYIIFAFIYSHVTHYLYLLYLVIMMNCAIFVLSYDLIVFGIITLLLISFFDELISKRCSDKRYTSRHASSLC